jgi:DNA topoisomerase VI subunit B
MTHKLQRETFRTSRLLDFFSVKELTAQVGHDKADWSLVAFKELFDNGLDATEDAELPPCLTVTVDRHGVTVADNGPGISPETVAGVLDFNVRVSSREAYVSPTRGAQGNAPKTIIAMPFVLDGKEGRVSIASYGIRHKITVRVDAIRQEPIIDHQRVKDRRAKSGTSFTVHWPNSAYKNTPTGRDISFLARTFARVLSAFFATRSEGIEASPSQQEPSRR